MGGKTTDSKLVRSFVLLQLRSTAHQLSFGKQMQTTGTRVLILTGRSLALALTVGFFSQVSTPALAQGFGPQGSDFPGQSQGMGSNQDSFLPPEVVPQADSGAGQFSMGATPGQLTAMPEAQQQMNMAGGNMSAKDMRKAAFESLMNTQLSNQMPQYDPAMAQGQASPFSANQMPGAQGQYAIGQPDWLATGSNPSNVGNDASSQYGNASQTQTLTGGSKVPIVRRDTRKGGFSNNLAGGAGMGAGLLWTQLRRPGSLFGLGFTGLTMTGFGSRNGFRF